MIPPSLLRLSSSAAVVALALLGAGTPALVRAADTLVGTLPGDFSVDNKGSANYAIPLALAPGRSGMAPQLSLAYSSAAGNGTLGLGFSLSTGYPQSITRGRSIRARDDVTRGISFSADDKFYLDGKRLVCVTTTPGYGKPGSVYRTEVDTFVSVVAQADPSDATRIGSFVVIEKTGVKMTFGKLGAATDGYQVGMLRSGTTNTPDSLAYAWALKRVEDPIGNRIDFTYADPDGAGDHVLSQIDYTANDQVSPIRTAESQVLLGYANDRPDKTFSYISGRRFAHDRRLATITAKIGGTEFRRYTLTYQASPDTGRSQLKSVKFEARESGTAAWQSAPETTFTWSSFNLNGVSAKSQALPKPASNEWGYRESAWGDFDGDGKEDYAILVNGGITVYRSTGKIGSGEQFTSAVWMALPSGFIAAHTTLIAMDFNGDGRKDLLLGRNQDGGRSGVSLAVIPCRSTGSTFVASTMLELATTTRTWFTVDPTDSQNDLGYLLRSVGGGVFARFVPGDYDGDGKEDILVHAYDGYRYLLKYSLATNQLEVGSAMNAGAPGKKPSVASWRTGWIGSAVLPTEYHWDITHPLDIRTMPCDLNGDGVTDYLWEDKTNTVSIEGGGVHVSNREWFASLSNGQGGATPAKSTSFMGIGSSSTGGASVPNTTDSVEDYSQIFFPADFNGDGITDFLVRNRGTSGWDLRIGTGLVDANSNPITENRTRVLARTFSANGETLHTVARFMPKATWDAHFQLKLDTSQTKYTSALARIQADSASNTFVMDINQDGMADLVWFVEYKKAYSDPADARDTAASSANKGWWVAYSTGTGLSAPQKLSNGVWSYLSALPPHGLNDSNMAAASVATPDLNGDGIADWVVSSSNFNGDELSFYAYNAGTFGDLITTVTDGLGRTTELSYKAAKDDSLYTAGADVAYPIREFRSSSPVVAEVWKDSGTNTAADRAQYSYQYSGRRVDLSGRGDLGFHSFITLDRQTNVFTYQFLAQSFPMTGMTTREQSYRYWLDGSTVKFRLVKSHDNTVVFDEVVDPANSNAAWGTVFPFISKAVESRWEDSKTEAHFSYSVGGPQSKPESLFTEARPAGAHIAITAKSTFDLQSEPLIAPPGSYRANDRTTDWVSAGTNAVLGSTSYTSFHDLFAGASYRKITYGNLRTLTTECDGSFTETVSTAYKAGTSVSVGSVSVVTLTGLAETVTASASAPDYPTEAAPTKRFTYWKKNNAIQTALVETETADASDDKLDFTTTYLRDELGRVKETTISGYVDSTTPDSSVAYTTAKVTAFNDRFDLAEVTQDAYGHEATTAYHEFFGLPRSAQDVNLAKVETDYDALGRAVQTRDLNLARQSDTTFAMTSGTASDWTKSQSVAVPDGVTGLALNSVYAMRTTVSSRAVAGISMQPAVTTYYDRLGRPIRTVKEGFAGQKAVSDTIYNSLGQVVAVSLPCNPSDPLTGPFWTKTTYDELGRVAKVVAPNGTETTSTYEGRATRVTVNAPTLGGVDPDAQSNTTLVDAKGRTVKVWNADNQPLDLQASTLANKTPSIEYKLDGFGRMRATVLREQAQRIVAEYDALGRQKSLDDPDKGLWQYTNNALGQVVRQEDARHSVTISTFDRLGRPLNRTTTEIGTGSVANPNGPVENAAWFYYDSADDVARHTVAKGSQGWIGALQRVESSTSSVPGYAPTAGKTTTLHYFDSHGRPAIDLTTIDGKWFYTCTEYDSAGRVGSVRHFWRPPGHEAPGDQPYVWQDFGYSYTYDTSSYLLELRDATGQVWWEADGTAGYDHLGRPTLVRKGHGHWTKRTYRPKDGMLSEIKTGLTPGAATVQNLRYAFDGLGNLVARADDLRGLSESFGYDTVNRLTTRNGATISSYANNGNISSKTDVTGSDSGAYTYSATKPHAVTAAFGYTMTYDDNGNLLTRTNSASGEEWSTRWAGFDKPRWLAKTRSGVTSGSEFVYDAARGRVVQMEFDSVNGSGVDATPKHYTRKRLYAWGATGEIDYKNLAASGAPNWQLDTIRLYVPGPDGVIGAMEFAPNGPTEKTARPLVYHYDHLGSVDTVTALGDRSDHVARDDNGKAARHSFDPWGQRRDPDDWSGAPVNTTAGGHADVTPRGFTGHEMMDDVGLVNMNGRIYDGLLGRFLSADILVQNPGSLQSFNRYSYIANNPLSGTDPSGYEAIDIVKAAAKKAAEEARERASRESARVAGGFMGLLNYVSGGTMGVPVAASARVRAAADSAQPAPAEHVEKSKGAAPRETGSQSEVKTNTAPTEADQEKRDGQRETCDSAGSNGANIETDRNKKSPPDKLTVSVLPHSTPGALFVMYRTWVLENWSAAKNSKGAVVQHIVMLYERLNSAGKWEENTRILGTSFDWTEAWPMSFGRNTITWEVGRNDCFNLGLPQNGERTTLTATAYYAPAADLTGFTPGGGGNSGDLPSIGKTPSWWAPPTDAITTSVVLTRDNSGKLDIKITP